jgi:hypothetical protein
MVENINTMITTEQFFKPCECRSVGECTHNIFAEEKALKALFREFSKAMADKLYKKFCAGHIGWDDAKCLPFLKQALRVHVEKGDMVDVANFAAMIWNIESGH